MAGSQRLEEKNTNQERKKIESSKQQQQQKNSFNLCTTALLCYQGSYIRYFTYLW